MKERYKIVYQGGEGEIVEKKSRFIAEIRPVESEEEATAFIAEVKKKYWDARHHCSAFTIGENNEVARCSDDGEPAQTGGTPDAGCTAGTRDSQRLCGCDPVLWRDTFRNRRTGAGYGRVGPGRP